jgi:hypothetical protein
MTLIVPATILFRNELTERHDVRFGSLADIAQQFWRNNLGLYDTQNEKHGHDGDRNDADFMRFCAKAWHGFAGLIRPRITVILICRGGVKPSRNRKRKKNHERHVERLDLMIRCVKSRRAIAESKKIRRIFADQAASELCGAVIMPSHTKPASLVSY